MSAIESLIVEDPLDPVGWLSWKHRQSRLKLIHIKIGRWKRKIRIKYGPEDEAKRIRMEDRIARNSGRYGRKKDFDGYLADVHIHERTLACGKAAHELFGERLARVQICFGVNLEIHTTDNISQEEKEEFLERMKKIGYEYVYEWLSDYKRRLTWRFSNEPLEIDEGIEFRILWPLPPFSSFTTRYMPLKT